MKHQPLVVSTPDWHRYNSLLDEEVGLLRDLRELAPGTPEHRAAVGRLNAVAARQDRLLGDLGFLGEGR